MHLTGANTIALAYHGLVDGALGGDEEAGAGDEGEDLLPGQLRELFALCCHLKTFTK